MAQGRDDNPEFDWNAYLGGLAHELKNPLSTINVNLQLLREDWAAEKGGLADRSVTKIDVILDESRRLERMLRVLVERVDSVTYDTRGISLVRTGDHATVEVEWRGTFVIDGRRVAREDRHTIELMRAPDGIAWLIISGL